MMKRNLDSALSRKTAWSRQPEALTVSRFASHWTWLTADQSPGDLSSRWNESDWPASLAFLAMMIILAYIGLGRMTRPIEASEQPTIKR